MSDKELILKVDNVSKRFCRDLKRSLFYGVQDIAREVVGSPPRIGELKKAEFWALQNVSFNLPRGKAVGLLGKNGCGKTTLLRIIAGLIKPTTGGVETRGRIAPLLSLGAGFNPVLSGRENVYINMSVLGLTTEEIDERYESVVDFAEIGYAMDAPLQSYSSGMQARLGFSCAIHTNPDILLLDEVTVVGDMQFQRKCEKKLRQIREGGTTFIVVSHSAAQIHALCDFAVYIKQGIMHSQGNAKEVIEQYEEDLYLTAGKAILAGEAAKPKSTANFELLEVTLLNEDGVAAETLGTLRPASVKIRFRADEYISNLHFLVKLYRLPSEDFFTGAEMMILHIGSLEDGHVYVTHSGEGEVTFQIDSLLLVQGAYQFLVECFGKDDSFLASRRSDRFVVKSRLPFRHCSYFQPRKWISKLAVDEAKLGFYKETAQLEDGGADTIDPITKAERLRERLASFRPLQRTPDGWIEWGNLVDLFFTEPSTIRWKADPSKPFKSFSLRALNGEMDIVLGYYFSEGRQAWYQAYVSSPLINPTAYELVCPEDMEVAASDSDSRPLAFRDVETEIVPGNQIIHPYEHLENV